MHSQCNAIRCSEIKFSEIAAKMLFGNVLIGSDQAARENPEVAFG